MTNKRQIGNWVKGCSCVGTSSKGKTRNFPSYEGDKLVIQCIYYICYSCDICGTPWISTKGETQFSVDTVEEAYYGELGRAHHNYR